MTTPSGAMSMAAAPLSATATERPAHPDDARGIGSVATRAIRISAASHYTADELDAWAAMGV